MVLSLSKVFIFNSEALTLTFLLTFSPPGQANYFLKIAGIEVLSCFNQTVFWEKIKALIARIIVNNVHVIRV